MHNLEVFFLEKLIGEDWFRYAGAFKDYEQANRYRHNLYPPLDRYRIARYERVEIMKIEEE